MPRSGEEVRLRLQQAALELYRKKGFDETTTAEIAARAQTTERTFFRHFADKREVLFGGEAPVQTAFREAVQGVPGKHAPVDVVFLAIRERIVPMLVVNRPVSEPRAKIIAAHPALRERELAKHAAMNAVVAAALETRGVAPNRAALAAAIGMAAFGQATQRWLDDETPGLDALVVEAFAELRALVKKTAPTLARRAAKR